MLYDSDIRKALVKGFRSIPEFCTSDTIIIHELDVCGGTSRMDVAVVNGKLHGYEIKSQQDNLQRLPFQVKDYNKVFNTVTIVTTDNHMSGVIDIVPEWWGIICATDDMCDVVFDVKREPELNPNIDKFRLAQFLWKDELLSVLHDKTHIKTGLKSKTRRALARLVADNLTLAELEECVKLSLKSRELWKAHRLQPRCDD